MRSWRHAEWPLRTARCEHCCACCGWRDRDCLRNRGNREQEGWKDPRQGWLGFISAYVALALTAVIGVVVFEFRSFLAIATVASSYDVFAGYRSLRLRGRRPRPGDLVLSVVALLAPLAFVIAIRALHKPWSPALTWSVLGGLIALAAYDLARAILPQSWLRRVWLQEHLYKMLAAFIAAAATGAATIFPRWAPWSALVPVIAGEVLTIYFLFAYKPSKARDDASSSSVIPR